jgi:hypothetical protein
MSSNKDRSSFNFDFPRVLVLGGSVVFHECNPCGWRGITVLAHNSSGGRRKGIETPGEQHDVQSPERVGLG